MREVVRELIDAVHSLKGISDNRHAELHAQLGPEELAEAPGRPKPAPAKADGPAGA